MQGIRKLLGIVGCVVPFLLFTGCGAGTPPTPTTQEPAPWGREATPPASTEATIPAPSISLTPEQAKAMLPVRLLSRGTRTERDPVIGTDINYIVYTVQVKNNTMEDVVRASGTLYYHDATGKRIDFDDFSLDSPIAAGATITMSHTFVHKESIPSRKPLGEIPAKELRLEFHPQFISYANGVGQEITYEN
jgi:hypothetical protein